MGKSTSTTQSVSQSAPPAFQMPYVTQMLGEAQRLYGQGGPGTYAQVVDNGAGPELNRSSIAPFTPNELSAQEGLVNSARTTLPEVADWTQQGYADALKLRDPSQNPYLPRVIESSIRPVFEQLTRSVLPNIRNEAVGVGGYGGSRQGIAEGLATREATKQAMDLSGNIMNNAWQFGNQQANNALQLAPMIQGVQTAPSEILGAVGSQERAYQQALMDQLSSTYEYNQRLPYMNLAEFGNYATRQLGGMGQAYTEVPPASTASQIAGGALTIPALISALKGLFG